MKKHGPKKMMTSFWIKFKLRLFINQNWWKIQKAKRSSVQKPFKPCSNVLHMYRLNYRLRNRMVGIQNLSVLAWIKSGRSTLTGERGVEREKHIKTRLCQGRKGNWNSYLCERGMLKSRFKNRLWNKNRQKKPSSLNEVTFNKNWRNNQKCVDEIPILSLLVSCSFKMFRFRITAQ